MGGSPFRGEVSPGLCKSYTPQTISGAHRQGQEDGGGCSWRRNLGAAEAASRLPGGWTPAPRAAAERSARNLLTGPEQRAANPAGGRGRASGRRDPAPSPRRRRVHRAFLSRAAQGRRRGARGRTRRPPPRRPGRPSPEPGWSGGQALMLIASPLGSGSHWLGRRRPALLTCPAALLAQGLPIYSPGPCPPGT